MPRGPRREKAQRRPLRRRLADQLLHQVRAHRLEPLLEQRPSFPALDRLAHHLRRLPQLDVDEHQHGGDRRVDLVEDPLVRERAEQPILGLFRVHLRRLGIGRRQRPRQVGAGDHVRQPAGEQGHAADGSTPFGSPGRLWFDWGMPSPGRKRLLACAALAAACWKSPRDGQRDYAQSLRPAPIGAQSRASGPVRPLRVRVYADPEYQAQTPRWSERIREQIDRANATLEAGFGVRLELEAPRTWKRADRFEPLDKALEGLAAADPGADVDWVIGFAPALGFASAAHEQLGMGAVFGRHLVVRGMFSLEETRALETVLDKLPREERDALLRERRIHKETAVLLHEWAHTLGAFHEHVPGSLMSPMYEPSQSGFSPGIVRLLLVSLEQRSARDDAGLSRWAAAYREEVRSSTTIWDAATRAEALRIGEQFFGSSRLAASPPDGTPREKAGPAERPGGDSPVANLALAHALLDRDDRAGAAVALARAESAFDK